MKDDTILVKVFDKLDKLDEDLTDLKIIAAKQHASLDEHMRRTLANEEAVSILKEELKPVIKSVETFKILGKAVLFITGSSTLLGLAKALFFS